VIIVAGLIARELGGGRLAQGLAAFSVMIAPVFMASGVLFQALPYDQLWWTLTAYCIVRLIKSGNPRWWIGIGVVIGLGMMTKYTMLFFGVSLAVGLLLTAQRRYLKTPWPWIAVGIALLIMLPNILWQIRHDFISLDYTDSINQRDEDWGRTQSFIPDQLLNVNPFTLPLVFAGLYFYFSRHGKPYRILGWIFVIALVLFLILKGRGYYLSSAYPMLLAAGAVLAEQRFRWNQSFIIGLVFAGILAAVPSLPILPINSGLWNDVIELNDTFPEMIGWEELVQTVAEVRDTLPPDETVAIFAANYGEAGAVDLYGSRYGLPNAISPTNTYRYWADDRLEADVYIVLGMQQEWLDNWFDEVTPAARVTNRYGVENEETRDHPVIYVCRHPKRPLRDFWDDLNWFG
jgi:hypothetical protein